MSRCHHCQIYVSDRTEICPLCRGVLEIGGETAIAYPDIPQQRKKLVLIRGILLFASLIAAAICLFIDLHTKNRLDWSLIATGGILVGLRVFFVMTNPVSGYRRRVLETLFAAVIYVMLIDYVTGFYGWSVNFVLPGAMFVLNFGLLLLMLINRRNWQSYMVYQILSIVIGLVPILLVYRGIVTVPLLSELAFASSVLLFLGTLIFGGRAALAELGRRFYIG